MDNLASEVTEFGNVTITSKEGSGSVVVTMSGDNKSLLDPLQSQGEDNFENPSPETEGQSAQKNKFSDESSSDTDTTSKGDVLTEPAASSEGAERKEDVQKGDSASGDAKEVQKKGSDADASKCSKPSGEDFPKSSSFETKDEKGKKEVVPTQVENESQDVEIDKEKKSSEEPKRGSKIAGSKKGKGKAPKGDLPEEENEELNKDAAQVYRVHIKLCLFIHSAH